MIKMLLGCIDASLEALFMIFVVVLGVFGSVLLGGSPF